MQLSPLFRELASFPVARDDRDCFFFTKDGSLGQLHRTGFRIRAIPGGNVVSNTEMFESPPIAVAIGATVDRVAVTTNAFFGRAHTLVFDLSDDANVRRIDRGGQRLGLDARAERLVCANGSRAVWVFDARSGEREAFLRLGDSFLVDAVLRPEGDELVVAAQTSRLYAWRLRDPAPYAECQLGAPVQCMALAPDGTKLAVLTADGIALARLATTGPALAWEVAPKRPVWGASSAPACTPTLGWVDDQHFVVLVRECVEREARDGRDEVDSDELLAPLFEHFLYLFSTRSEQWLLRVLIDDYADIATDPRSRRLVYANEVTAHVFELTAEAFELTAEA